MVDQLGPFQPIWEAWEEARDELQAKPLSHYERAIEIQFEELRSHLAAGNKDAAAREAVDIISVALNLLRWLRLRPDEIAEVARLRAERRMSGQARAILEKYQRMHDI